MCVICAAVLDHETYAVVTVVAAGIAIHIATEQVQKGTQDCRSKGQMYNAHVA